MSQNPTIDLVALAESAYVPSLPHTNGAHGDQPKAQQQKRKQKNRTVAATELLSEKIRSALTQLGYDFTFNVCTGEMLVNGDPIDDGIAATIRVQMRDMAVAPVKSVEDVYVADARKNRFHPVVKYLRSLTWDGEDHIAALAGHVTDSHAPITYSDGTGQRTVFHAFLRRWLIGAVARAFQRSVQVPMFVWAGAQGRGKSYLAHWLCPLPDMFIESAIYPDNSDHMKYLASRWIWAVDELGATTRRADIEGLKAFVTRDVSTFRTPYARYGSNLPALACFIGTVNDSGAGFLNDPTGNRRFAVVDIENIDHGYSSTIDVSQVWAQAYALYQRGEGWQFTAEERQTATVNADAHQTSEPIYDAIVEHFTIDIDKSDWSMTADQIMDCLIRTHEFRAQKDIRFSTQIGMALKKLGVQKIRVNRVYRYVGISHTPHKPK